LAALALSAACSDSNDTTGPSSTSTRTFNQVQRLGNPLVSEVFLAKKDHAFHGSIGPDGDATAFGGTVKGFVAAFRPQATTLQNTLASVLLPDMLIVQTDKAELGAVERVGRPQAHRRRRRRGPHRDLQRPARPNAVRLQAVHASVVHGRHRVTQHLPDDVPLPRESEVEP
jgi:hypothetical protein